jgi:PAS domain S-box-containing protein
MDDVSMPVDGASPSVKAAQMIALISRVDIKTRLTLCFVLIIALMSVGTGILLWQSRVMRAEANRLKEMDEQFMEVQRVHALVLWFRNESEQLVKARNPARLQQEAPALRNQLNDSLRQTKTVFRGIEPNNTLDPTVLPTLETIQGSLPSQIDSLTTLASVADWDALSQRMEQPVETLENLSAELVDTTSRDIREKHSEATRQIEHAQNRIAFSLAGVSGLTIMIAALLGFAITQSITRPLRSLVNGASALASGEFGHHIPVQGRDELAHLSRVFNQTTLVLRQLYENLRQSEQELRNVVDYLAEAQRLGHIGSWVLEPTGAFEYWSQELFRIYGLGPERDAPTLDEYLACVHLLDREFMAALIKRMLAEGLGCDVIKRIVRPSGEVRHIRCVGAPVVENGILKRIVGNAIDVTEHELLTRELQRREAYLADAQRLSHTGSFGWNPDTEELVWSDETYRIFEYDCATKPTLDMVVERIHTQDRALAQQVIDRASQTGTDFEHQYRLLLGDGRVKHVHAIAHALQDSSGNREFIGAVTDITERKTAEEALRSSEEYLLEAQRLTCTGSWAWSPVSGNIRYWSKECYRVLGFDPAESLPRFETFFQRIHPDDQAATRERFEKAICDKVDFQMDYRIVHPDGETRNIHVVSHPTLGPSGDLREFVGTVIDVTDRLRAEERIRLSERELRTIVETIPVFVGTALPDGSVDFVSQSWLDYTGLSREQWLGWGWMSVIHPEDLDRGRTNWRAALATGTSVEQELRYRRADGTYHWFLSSNFPLRDEEGNVVKWYGVMSDIDDRKQAEDHLRDTRLRLGIASRIATVAELAGSIAHELNQPLMSILASAQAAKRWLNAAPPNVPEVNWAIERVIRDARAADETMQHIRALFKQESFYKKDVNIPNILREVVRVVQEDPKKRDVPIECRFEESLPVVPVDQIQIQQVFINLIVNAFEALEGQQVAPLVVLRAATDSNGMLIQVIDNGPGVDDPDRIFDAFMTTKEKGMGIGLTVSRTIVEAHGGQLWAENNETGGATFNVALPLSHASPTTAYIQEYA